MRVGDFGWVGIHLGVGKCAEGRFGFLRKFGWVLFYALEVTSGLGEWEVLELPSNNTKQYRSNTAFIVMAAGV